MLFRFLKRYKDSNIFYIVVECFLKLFVPILVVSTLNNYLCMAS